jgi:hypothetical protein
MMKHFQLTAEYVKDVGDPSHYDREFLKKEEIDVTLSSRQWTYQYCTEFGYFQTPYQMLNMRSKLLVF